MEFFVVYIREAHPLDGRSPLGGNGMPIVEDPVTLEERAGVANVCMTRLALEPIPALVDGVDDAVNTAYQAQPDRLYLVGRDGRIAYQGGPGPWGFDPEALEAAIQQELSRGHVGPVAGAPWPVPSDRTLLTKLAPTSSSSSSGLLLIPDPNAVLDWEHLSSKLCLDALRARRRPPAAPPEPTHRSARPGVGPWPV